jgi:hypothetical protein
VALLDGRGVSLTLSHFCPTAASMLFRDAVPLALVESPGPFPCIDSYEGLDARHVMPPLLRPGMLWDLDGYSAWEEQAVSFLGRTRLTPHAALLHLQAVAERIQEWFPGGNPLRTHVIQAFERRSEDAMAARDVDSWDGKSAVVNRYLAARLFASWVPYRADRLTAVIDHLQRTLAVLKEAASGTELLEAIRATDLRVVHGS